MGLFQMVVNLALVIYHALDYTHAEDEERLISPDLEGLITDMTACDAEEEEECGMSEGSETSESGRADTDDEGIERDADPAPRRTTHCRRFMLKDVIENSSYPEHALHGVVSEECLRAQRPIGGALRSPILGLVSGASR
ncbi:hypothetical protein RR46_05823 [Papilio xuthus]|uniref:KIND domain-containing protein n=1 Tax=Papilio xuthus TaxID=66420 RepID=A0A194PMB0_PAPXU|nr:hypothetical protein RR46_05823 [Papilio xuthus]